MESPYKAKLASLTSLPLEQLCERDVDIGILRGVSPKECSRILRALEFNSNYLENSYGYKVPKDKATDATALVIYHESTSIGRIYFKDIGVARLKIIKQYLIRQGILPNVS